MIEKHIFYIEIFKPVVNTIYMVLNHTKNDVIVICIFCIFIKLKGDKYIIVFANRL
jgi:hypothetical protein